MAMPAVLSPSMSPFVGLRPFERTDSLYYFGRGDQIRALLATLHRSRFLAVVGSSGCGKSSLVRAGLMPALEAGFLVQDRDRWHTAAFKPGNTPFRHLAMALLQVTDQPPGMQPATDLAERLLDDGADAALTLLQNLPEWGQSNLLILVDQFEELFRFSLHDDAGAADRAEAEAFVALLLALTRRDGLPIYCALTMRSDFIGDCDAFAGLPEAINKGQFLVPRLSRAQRREAIAGPVRLVGQHIAPRLVDELLNTRLETRDDLPILQHCLLRCWDHWAASAQDAALEDPPDRPIDLDDLQAVGTLHGALNQHADQALAELDPADAPLVQRLFQALTEVDASNRSIRRPTRLSRLRAITGADDDALQRIIERFRSAGRSFLVLSGDADPIVDISHESLIRQWDRLRTWTYEESDSAKRYRRLAESAALHSPEQPRFYREADLAEAKAWKRTQAPNRAWAERYHPGFDRAMAFLCESRLHDIRERQRRKAERAEREQLLRDRANSADRARQVARRWTAILGLLSVLMAIFAVVAVTQWWDAQVKTERALTAERSADYARVAAVTAAKEADAAREHAEQEQQRAEKERLRAEREAERASETLGLAHITEARRTLLSNRESRSNKGYREALIHLLEGQRQRLPKTTGAADPRQFLMSAQEIEGAFGRWLWSSQSLQVGASIVDLRLSRAGDLVTTAHADGDIYLWRYPPGTRIKVFSHPGEQIDALAINPDGSLLAAAFGDGGLRTWDIETGEPRLSATLEDGRLVDLEFGADTLFAVLAPKESSTKQGTIVLLDSTTGAIKARVAVPEAVVNDIVLSPDGQRLLAACSDGLTRVWQLMPEPVPTPRTIPDKQTSDTLPLAHIAIRDDASYFATVDASGTIVVRNLASGAIFRSIDVAAEPNYWWSTTGLALSPDGLKLAVGRRDGGLIVDVYSMAIDRRLWLHRGAVSAIAYHPSGGAVLTSGWDGRVLSWNPTPPTGGRRFPGHFLAVRALTFDPSGTILASAAADGFSAVWDTRTGDPASMFYPENGSYDLFNDIAISQSGNAAALAEGNGGVSFFRRTVDAPKKQWRQTRPKSVTEVEISPGESIVAVGDFAGEVALLRAADGELLGILDADAEVSDMRFDPSGETLATATEDGYVRLWSVQSQDQQRAWQAHTKGETFVDWSPNGEVIASGGADGKVKRWRLQFEPPREEQLFPREHEPTPEVQEQSQPPATAPIPVRGVRFNPTASWLASAHLDGSVRIWTEASPEFLDEIATVTPDERNAGTRELISLAVHPEQPIVVAGFSDGVIEMHRVVTEPAEVSLGSLSGMVRALSIADNGSVVLAGTSSGDLELLSATPGAAADLSIGDQRSWVRAVAVSRDGGRVASAGIDRAIQVAMLDGTALAEPIVLNGHPASVSALAWSPDADVLASSSDAGDMRLWRLPDFTEQALVGASNESSTLVFSRNGQVIFAGGPESVARWDVETSTAIRSIPLPDETVTVLASCASRDLIAAGTASGAIRLLEPFTGELVGALQGHEARIAALSFDPDCRVLSSRSRDGSWLLWDVVNQAPLRQSEMREDITAGPLFSAGGRSLIFSLESGEVMRQAFDPWDLLIANGRVPSIRAAVLSESLQRLWGLRVAGFNLRQDLHRDFGSNTKDQPWALTHTVFSLPDAQARDSDQQAEPAGFDMAPLMAPAPPGEDKLDQILDWIDAQATDSGP